MAKAPVVEDADMLHAFKVAAVTGQTPTRDVALLYVLYGRQTAFGVHCAPRKFKA